MNNLSTIFVVWILTFVQAFAQDTTHILGNTQKYISTFQDSLENPKSSNFSWKLFYPVEMGVGYGSRSNVGYGNPDPGLALSLDLFSFGLGIKSLNNLGIGTSVVEIMGSTTNAPEFADNSLSSTGMPFSWFPVYVYYPLFSKRQVQISNQHKTKVRSPFIYAFAGGSAWAKPNNYFHAGLSAILYTYAYKRTKNDYLPPSDIAGAIGYALARGLMSAFPRFNISLQTGFFYSSEYLSDTGRRVEPDIGFYATVRFGLGAAF